MSFTDPTLAAGGGLSLYLTRSLVLRPDVRVLWALSDGERHAIVMATASLGWRFEFRSVTPSR
jgi:hypothetical protein